MRRIGAHVSISGGLDEAMERIGQMGGNCLQIFSFSPRSWIGTPLVRGQASDIRPIFIHAKYLINLGSPQPELAEK